MFQNNPILNQLKIQLHDKIIRTEGIVKSTEKGFGFLETNKQKKYFISPNHMKRVMHGDRIIAVIYTDNNRERAEPEKLIEPFLNRFVGCIKKQGNYLNILPFDKTVNNIIYCKNNNNLLHSFQENEWAIAEMKHHPLNGFNIFYAELVEFITDSQDHFIPWHVTLARHNLDRESPNITFNTVLNDNNFRQDLTHLDFITIDNDNTEDIDDALYIEENTEGSLNLTIAIADPTAYISEGSEVDKIASLRAFTNYLPGFHIPILPYQLSNYICSLHPQVKRPALICQVKINKNGAQIGDSIFSIAWIKVKAKLIYENVSNWLNGINQWIPCNDQIAQQIHLLHRFCLIRRQWRAINALVFQDYPNYQFLIGKNGEVLNITMKLRNIANYIIEEAMILANICAANTLRNKLGFGIYNTHGGFDISNINNLVTFLEKNNIKFDPTNIMTLQGFCELRRKINSTSNKYLEKRIRKFQKFAEMSINPQPHFGLGLEIYATWTSPIRKYSDMVNHRLLKSIIFNNKQFVMCPNNKLIIAMNSKKRLYRIAERDINEWLYAIFLTTKIGSNYTFNAEIVDVLSKGMRVRLIDNGAMAFLPASLIHITRDEIIFYQEEGIVKIKNSTIIYHIGDHINVKIIEVRMQNHSIIVQLIV